jgi:hypothetical protein
VCYYPGVAWAAASSASGGSPVRSRSVSVATGETVLTVIPRRPGSREATRVRTLPAE